MSNSFDHCPERRAVLLAGIGLGMQLSAGGRLFAQEAPESMRPKEGDLLVKSGDAASHPLTPEDIPLGGMPTLAWPMDPASKTVRSGTRLNRVLLLRFDSDQLSSETRPRAADGVVAYSAICTHNGCEVSEWVTDEQVLFCACHESKFAPKDGGKVVDGPAPKMLPALPLKLVDKNLVVARPFTARITFDAA